jgi:hypothetical protein
MHIFCVNELDLISSEHKKLNVVDDNTKVSELNVTKDMCLNDII